MSDQNITNGLPPEQGLYSPANERDNCGLGFLVNINGEPSHEIINKGIQILINLTHRGACGCDSETGDGAGILIQIPHKFFPRETAKLGFTLPARGRVRRRHGLPAGRTPAAPALRRHLRAHRRREEGLTVLGWRDTPVNGDAIGRVARARQPYIEQIFVARARRRWIEDDVRTQALSSCGSAWRPRSPLRKTCATRTSSIFHRSLRRTIVYKGLLLAPQIANFYNELSDPDTMSALCLVHQRFSTNTFPTWQLAHPFRLHLPQRRDQYGARQRRTGCTRGSRCCARRCSSDDMKKLFPVITAGRQRFGRAR